MRRLKSNIRRLSFVFPSISTCFDADFSSRLSSLIWFVIPPWPLGPLEVPYELAFEVRGAHVARGAAFRGPEVADGAALEGDSDALLAFEGVQAARWCGVAMSFNGVDLLEVNIGHEKAGRALEIGVPSRIDRGEA